MNINKLKELELLEQLGGATTSSTELDVADTSFKQVSPSSGTAGTTSSIEEKAVELLGAGVPAEAAARALGVTPARISQLLADSHFADRVSELRYASLQKHNARDGAYDSLEDKLIKKLDKALPLMIKPDSILKGIQVINNAKRRGQSSPDQTVNQKQVVNLVLPTVITQKFSVDTNNQVIQAGDQSLITMQAGSLLKQVEERAEARLPSEESLYAKD